MSGSHDLPIQPDPNEITDVIRFEFREAVKADNTEGVNRVLMKISGEKQGELVSGKCGWKLFPSGGSPNFTSPIWKALYGNSLKMLDLFLENGADPNIKAGMV